MIIDPSGILIMFLMIAIVTIGGTIWLYRFGKRNSNPIVRNLWWVIPVLIVASSMYMGGMFNSMGMLSQRYPDMNIENQNRIGALDEKRQIVYDYGQQIHYENRLDPDSLTIERRKVQRGKNIAGD